MDWLPHVPYQPILPYMCPLLINWLNNKCPTYRWTGVLWCSFKLQPFLNQPRVAAFLSRAAMMGASKDSPCSLSMTRFYLRLKIQWWCFRRCQACNVMQLATTRGKSENSLTSHSSIFKQNDSWAIEMIWRHTNRVTPLLLPITFGWLMP